MISDAALDDGIDLYIHRTNTEMTDKISLKKYVTCPPTIRTAKLRHPMSPLSVRQKAPYKACFQVSVNVHPTS
ncbi:hypothetical protein GWC77_23045 [Paraburkholderia sp. NMBU_R16]|uniref:hypothetical protein n=1 Tax=Paraburkholderia sp. NMBU_R16 TaxID=2698676 RepID=UPI0015661366|nr:hypothetical protein [Paraburkholderia sp. NMBU_R16]NRO98796.1 hypothetical protein [Paraburkholderia sp. NMBU_R16]